MKSTATEAQIEAVAFNMWRDALHKEPEGVPKHPNGAWMTYWELFDVWLKSPKRLTYINHVKKYYLNRSTD